ncbi:MULTISPECIES: spike base protein, RCAP_Rcc01079 family [Rhizobium/Agrobacterium group]|uniref:Uncharacterized protein n=1 Tax=Agrobacterium genomosp. 2 str. CFBP 5494 TaxID=1183436 RepID=A0A9W5EY93_9HYPH|nr:MULTISPECIES: hypothetical protein [Rhizobium/Agrobacterium group]CAD7043728.1 hypothetical protein RP007_01062 [Rhizobium sp. P007]CUW85734.1 hypothetical protein AGR2A_Cc100243 [Agrobacterium genomosp. 2 str. CFBP 5494]
MFDRQQSIREASPVDLSSADQSMPTNKPTRTVYCGSAGNLVVELVGNPGVSITYAVLAGTRHDIQVSKFIKTGTTATAGLIAEF